MELTERITHLLDEKFQTDEVFADCFTVEVELKPGNKLYVFADSDSGMTFEKCQKLSRYLESHLDANGWLGEKYVLEVSSPGVGRPLKFPRQFVKNVGRNLQVTRIDASEAEGLLSAADEQQIVLTQTVIEREGKKKKEVVLETVIPYADIAKAIVKIVF